MAGGHAGPLRAEIDIAPGPEDTVGYLTVGSAW
jgi:hypothetical protein